MLAKSLATSFPEAARHVHRCEWPVAMILPSHVLVIPPAALVRLQEAGRLTHATSLARVRVFTRCLRRLTSSVLRTVPTNTIALIAPLLELRMCHTGDPAPPPSAPDSLVIVVEAHPCEQHGRSIRLRIHLRAARAGATSRRSSGTTSSSRTAVLPMRWSHRRWSCALRSTSRCSVRRCLTLLRPPALARSERCRRACSPSISAARTRYASPRADEQRRPTAEALSAFSTTGSGSHAV